MSWTSPYRSHHYLGEHANDATALALIQALKWDSAGTGSGNPQNGMLYYNTTSHVYRAYFNGAWTNLTPGLIQTKRIRIPSDTTSGATSFADLLSQGITTGATEIQVIATASLSNNSANRVVNIGITVDGVLVSGAQEEQKTANAAASLSASYQGAVTAAAHTVKLRWKTSGGTMQCRPVSNSDQEHAQLIINEVVV